MATLGNQYTGQYLSTETIQYSDLCYHRLVLPVLGFRRNGIIQFMSFVPGFFGSTYVLRFIYVIVCIITSFSFLLLCSVSLSTCYTISLFILLLINICVIPSFWLMLGSLQGQIQLPSLEGGWLPRGTSVVVLHWLGQSGTGNYFQSSLFFLPSY